MNRIGPHPCFYPIRAFNPIRAQSQVTCQTGSMVIVASRIAAQNVGAAHVEWT